MAFRRRRLYRGIRRRRYGMRTRRRRRRWSNFYGNRGGRRM